ncbi:MAG: H-NS histone family protein [Zoogloeaceae bacterium]|nr:H-NS histone family protein [Zoogloeaceae bacterium]
MDLSSMNLADLRRLQGRIEGEITRRTSSAKKDLLKKVQKLAAEAGMSLDDLIAAEAVEKKSSEGNAPKKPRGKSKTAGIKVPAKYRHPNNDELAWTGRGRKPKWVEDWLASGGTMEQIQIAA